MTTPASVNGADHKSVCSLTHADTHDSPTGLHSIEKRVGERDAQRCTQPPPPSEMSAKTPDAFSTPSELLAAMGSLIERQEVVLSDLRTKLVALSRSAKLRPFPVVVPHSTPAATLTADELLRLQTTTQTRPIVVTLPAAAQRSLSPPPTVPLLAVGAVVAPLPDALPSPVVIKPTVAKVKALSALKHATGGGDGVVPRASSASVGAVSSGSARGGISTHKRRFSGPKQSAAAVVEAFQQALLMHGATGATPRQAAGSSSGGGLPLGKCAPPAGNAGSLPASRKQHHANVSAPERSATRAGSKWDISQRMREIEAIQTSNSKALERTHSGFTRTRSRTEVSPTRPVVGEAGSAAAAAASATCVVPPVVREGSERGGKVQFAAYEEMRAAAAAPLAVGASAVVQQRTGTTAGTRRSTSLTAAASTEAKSTKSTKQHSAPRKLSVSKLAAKSPRVVNFSRRLVATVLSERSSGRVGAEEFVADGAAHRMDQGARKAKPTTTVHVDPTSEEGAVPPTKVARAVRKPPWSNTTKVASTKDPVPLARQEVLSRHANRPPKK